MELFLSSLVAFVSILLKSNNPQSMRSMPSTVSCSSQSRCSVVSDRLHRPQRMLPIFRRPEMLPKYLRLVYVATQCAISAAPTSTASSSPGNSYGNSTTSAPSLTSAPAACDAYVERMGSYSEATQALAILPTQHKPAASASTMTALKRATCGMISLRMLPTHADSDAIRRLGIKLLGNPK